MRLAEARMVAVLGPRQGSGVLLTQRLVLTATHVLGGESSAMVAVPGERETARCTRVWTGAPGDCDAVLLVAERDLVADGVLPPLRFGTLTRAGAVHNCQVFGFPQVQRFAADQLEAVQVLCTLMPTSGWLRERYVLHSRHHPPRPLRDGSPWAGLSGGPVFSGPVLLGMVIEDRPGWQHSAIDAIPIEKILLSPGFSTSDLAHGLRPVLEALHPEHPADFPYEDLYAKAIKARYSRMEIFGLDDLGSNENSWDLDTAYLSLEALAPGTVDRPDSASLRPEPHRIEELLGSRPRAVLRGEAGAGKTTLVWWLASHTACRTLPEELAALNGLIPFVIPMRSLTARGITTPTPAQLPTIARLQVDEAPSGWAGRVLEAGRALLLVDGLDELPKAERGPARRWLSDLLRMYPDTRCLVTVRPRAVDNAWLEPEGFEELQLLPMSDGDIQSFVAAWHKAARLECDGYADELRAEHERARLTALERDLAQEFQRNAGLRDLARTPLLCAVICALHRRRQGLLPRTRWHLYEAALAMLLGNRDAHRRVGSPEGIDLTIEDSRQLLQRIAVWLVRNGRAELSREQAVRQLEQAMKGLRRVREQGSAKQVLTHLLNRSGLLQERTADSLQFIHRTFQDYLAAKEFQDSDSLDELLGHAEEEQWQDVIRLVIGHCGRGEVRRVIVGLIETADVTDGRWARWALRTLAVECAISAAYLDDELHKAVWDGLGALGPPTTEREVELLSAFGPEILPVLPGPERLAAEPAQHVVKVLSSLGDAALPLLKRYGQHTSARIRGRVADAWGRFEARAFVEHVLTDMRLDDIRLVVSSPEQLAQLPALGPIGSLDIVGGHRSDSIDRSLSGRPLTGLSLTENPVASNLDFIRDHPEIRNMRITGCYGLRDMAALADSGIQNLTLEAEYLSFATLNVLAELPVLASLRLFGLPSDSGGRIPPLSPEISTLSLSHQRDPVRLDGISALANLRSLHIEADLSSPAELDKLAGLNRLHTLELRIKAAEDLVKVKPLRQVRSLGLTLTEKLKVAAGLFRAFPEIDELHLRPAVPGLMELDVSDQLASRVALEVWTSEQQQLKVIGAERLGDRLTIRSGHRA
ncbi:NACHT domain-containing protein [Streptomyces hesseae]|uniref:NACHT domain-containing protein n=1 Tax=Streptomyces hesseae TaxID=3075519 RepID=A0ABU2SXD3_9ACTN|nr:NACHT domain-containing protein [Streptomyces sp. DSM 40473]MDT0453256.1 NACHT domain-containing protein [Streptomyces sp. DSM 40473]